ncbi:MAG: hypothetical protein HDR01_02145 [Lachnospiraceae bacterium]|nr:hypothetical protein [Lachnospiraceae bacterium]
MKKVLGKKLANESGLLVSYACGCLCFAQCACPYPDVNPKNTVDAAQNYSNNVQNDTKLLLWS